jgi:hypothetical protein
MGSSCLVVGVESVDSVDLGSLAKTHEETVPSHDAVVLTQFTDLPGPWACGSDGCLVMSCTPAESRGTGYMVFLHTQS